MRSFSFLVQLSISSTCLFRIAVDARAQTGGGPTPQEVVIKAVDAGSRVKERKTLLTIHVDPYETLRTKLEPALSVLLPELPLAFEWRYSYPQILTSPRVVEAWRSDLPINQGIVFHVLDRLQDALGRQVEPNEAKYCQWTLSIVDESGEIFQYYAGNDGAAPPKELLWDGRNDRGDWVQVGHSYSPVYKFVTPDGSQHTAEDPLMRLATFTRQEPDGLHISLDLGALFGPTKILYAPDPQGTGVLRAVADYIKLHDEQVLSNVHVYGLTDESAKAQAVAVSDYLVGELMMESSGIVVKGEKADPLGQRVEILLQNRLRPAKNQSDTKRRRS